MDMMISHLARKCSHDHAFVEEEPTVLLLFKKAWKSLRSKNPSVKALEDNLEQVSPVTKKELLQKGKEISPL